MNAPTPPVPFPQRQPLPPNEYHPIEQTHIYEAYELCLQNEREVGNDAKRLSFARCLGYLIREVPNADAQLAVVDEVMRCEGDHGKMDSLASHYIDHLLRLFRSRKGRTPIPSDHPSRPSFEMDRAFYSTVADPAPKNHSAAKRSALVRDNHRCMVTGMVDDESVFLFQNVTETTPTNFCHIVPPSTNWDLDPQNINQPKARYSGTVWTILRWFGIGGLVGLNGGNYHRLSNGLTMDVTLHGYFDNLRLWFEEVLGHPNTYKIYTLRPQMAKRLLPNPRFVTFTTTTNLELPDARYLRLHAAVCRVAHMSGAAEYLEHLDREVEDLGVLAHDGSSGDILRSRLGRLVVG